MLQVSKLNFGFSDAENYRRRENKDLFNHIFVRTEALDHLCSHSTFFLIGEKGTGKTAYAIYLANNNYNNTTAILKYIRETEYRKFLSLKREKHLALSDYTNIWKVIIYLLLAVKIGEKASEASILKRAKFRSLIEAINEYYNNAFSPEIISALNFVEKSKQGAEILLKHAKLSGEESETISFSEQRFQTNLMFIQKKLEEALYAAKLEENHLLLIDGIDIRPDSIPYEDYLECVKGLANAVWSVNNDFFANIKASKGRLRAVLLIRPDIFDSLGLQNQNNKARDNAVLLDWRTTYSSYRTSSLFSMADRLLAAQQPDAVKLGEAWDYYFPFHSVDTRRQQDNDEALNSDSRTGQSSFVAFLRFSFYRPRDIVTMMSILQEQYKLGVKAGTGVFRAKDFDDPEFRRKYADYLLGEIKDHLAFYYSGVHYEDFLKFFQYLGGKLHFTYEEYLEAFMEFEKLLKATRKVPAEFFASPDIFLQFLFELNIISWVQDTDDAHQPFIHWSFRERTLSNIAPKVKSHERYGIHYGLGKAFNIGKRFKNK